MLRRSQVAAGRRNSNVWVRGRRACESKRHRSAILSPTL